MVLTAMEKGWVLAGPLGGDRLGVVVGLAQMRQFAADNVRWADDNKDEAAEDHGETS